MQIKKLTIPSSIRNFSVYFEKDFDFIEDLLQISNSVVIVGVHVYRLYRKFFKIVAPERLIVIPLEEKNKTLDTVMILYKRLLQFSAKKNLTVISFGGGTNQDVVGFVASTLYRGIQWVYVPTTLLAMADSAVGLKTSLNFLNYKNVIGTFYPPHKVYICVRFLGTLPEIEYLSGLGEITKFFLMKKDAREHFRESVEAIDTLRKKKDGETIASIIVESIQIKLSYMKGDEFDLERRNLLNYGHELGHALESVSKFHIPHGIGVLLGILFANAVSVTRQWLDKRTCMYINEKLLLPNIPVQGGFFKKNYFDADRIIDCMKQDKKRTSDGLVLVLPKENLSLCKVHDITSSEVRAGLMVLTKTVGF
ncbi:hypothetical protein HY948_03560 [Candidatus Gottesmanbacteria bacterium]|nr:hypothetical protein [Candidatus Gottesmanbacteria bacterium]